MPRKSVDPLAVETKQYHVFNPEDVKETVEIVERAKPSREEIEVVEKKGRVKKEKKNPEPKKTKQGTGDYILVITEKPQAAAKIASALADDSEIKINTPGGVSYYELQRQGKKIIVACAVGHLFSVAQLRKGGDYPIFDIGWKPNF